MFLGGRELCKDIYKFGEEGSLFNKFECRGIFKRFCRSGIKYFLKKKVERNKRKKEK